MNRLEQCLSVMKQLRDLGIPTEYPPMKELSKRMTDYIKTGDPWSGKIKFEAYDRVADVILPRRENIEVSVNLRKIKK